MFYSQCLLSKKGTLGNIWVAAHCLKRLKKDQVAQTDISSSVEKILLDEVPVVTYRILAYLLLGVVRIYSKKVEYLYNDCNQVLIEICQFAGQKSSSIAVNPITFASSYMTVTRPERFELDAFDLEIVEDDTRLIMNPNEDTTYQDARTSGDAGHCPLDKLYNAQYPSIETATCFGVPSTSQSANRCIDSLTDVNHGNLGISSHNESTTITDDEMVKSPSHSKSILQNSMENIRNANFILEECLEPMLFDESEEELDTTRGVEQVNINTNNDGFIVDEEEPPDLIGEEKKQMEEEHIVADDPMTPLKNTESHRVNFILDVTPESKFPATSENCFLNAGVTTPELLAVSTPAAKERARIPRKRKCAFDDVIVLSNKVVKEIINDASDLVCKRTKLPHTCLHIWKATRLSNLLQIFSDPLVPCAAYNNSGFLFVKKMSKAQEKDERHRIARTTESVDEAVKGQDTLDYDAHSISPVPEKDRVESISAIRVGNAKSDSFVPAKSSLSNTEEGILLEENGELNFSLADEEMNVSGGGNPEDVQNEKSKYELSTRTRRLAKFLYKNFENRKKQKQDEEIKLSHVLQKKSSRESAKAFYEILVLKTRQYIDVKQDNPYDDIYLKETPKLKSCWEEDHV
ncbi:sister chromatid cohesion 1 protein 2 isoform X2 [Impatiens glandulifera]|uniref:sister chromatid cohesion 1 protein 2 isoform X2 n=1 Tax=Impatiens glandulifera TaxID=253017 RepID=UPI001FB070EC|nr:sister chromatid cohesion 1 protein 2 isoform X2 [Impatiens glandulifera]